MLSSGRGTNRGYAGGADQSTCYASARGAEKVLIIGRPSWLAFIATVLSGYESIPIELGGEHVMERILSKLDCQDGRNKKLRFCVCEVELATPEGQMCLELVKQVRKHSRCTFIAVWSPSAAESATARLACLDFGANMVTQCTDSLVRAATQVTRPLGNGRLECVACGMSSLTEDELWEHYPLFHVNHQSISCHCHICHSKVRNLAVHLQNEHGPPGRGEMHSESMRTLSLFSFALVVCRHPDGRFLLVQEFANQGFWLPGGAVDSEESLQTAAVRETKEEAGLDVELTGIIKIEHTARDGYVRLRIIFSAVPKFEGQLPKSIPDYESVGAAWVPYEEIKGLRLRGYEPLSFCGHVYEGKPVYPLSLLEDRGT